jgi:ribonuclease T2
MRAGLQLAFAACLVATAPVAAFEPMQGCFVAEQACAAPRSIRRASSPGDVRLEAGGTYELLGANKVAATHFQVRVPGASPDARWVEVACGRTVEECSPDVVEPEPTQPTQASHASNLLAVSWQPAFCETHRTKPECASQTDERFDAVNFSLHGLWPQPRERAYCGVGTTEKAIDRRGRWDLLPPVELDAATRKVLDLVMPGTQSLLERHEWIKHGTCYSATAQEYFAESVRLLQELNASPVRELVASRRGAAVQLDELRAAFDEAFGAGAGERVALDCDRAGGRTVVTELKLNLAGEVTAETTLADLLAAAPEAGESCLEGTVDPAGFGAS